MNRVGDVLSVSGLFYQHCMLCVGPDSVIHATKGNGVVMSNLREYAAGRRVNNHGRWTRLSNSEVVDRAFSMIGEPYDFFERNCEHFVRLASGVRPESRQLQLLCVTLLILAAWCLNRLRSAEVS